MTNSWKRTTLGDAIALQRGHDLPEKVRRPGNVPVLGSFGVTGFHDAAKAKGPGVTLGRSGASFGVATYTEHDYWPLNTALYVTDFRGNHPRFVYYLLRTLDFQGYNSGSAQPSLNRNYVASIPLTLPPPDEQAQIAASLGGLDDQLTLLTSMNRTLDAMARALFRSWFVDFDPVRAKMEGRPTGLANDVAALFPERLVDSPMGEVPEGWDVCSLSACVDLLSGGTPRTTEASYWTGSIPWFSVKDAPLDSDVFVLRTEKTITEQGVANSAAKVLPAGTTIVSARGTVGKLALVGVPMAMNQSCYGVRGRDGFGDYFTYYLLRRVITDLQQNTHGSVFDTITRATFDAVKCVRPSSHIASAFEATAAPLLDRIRLNGEQSCTLTHLRDTILPKLLSGEVRVPTGTASGVAR